MRILDDDGLARKELKLLQELGVFQDWLPELNKWLKTVDDQELVGIPSKGINPIQKLILLIDQLPHEKRSETLLILFNQLGFEIS